jgi:hypothetical protein
MIVSGRQTPASERESQVSAEEKPLDSALAITDAAVSGMPGSLIHAPQSSLGCQASLWNHSRHFVANLQVSKIHREVTRFSYSNWAGPWATAPEISRI